MRLNLAPEPTMRVDVRVTFLRMAARPTGEIRPLPRETRVEHARDITVPFYRYLYNTVGAAHLWWLRRVASDAEVGAALADPKLAIHVLYRGGAPGGFYELERRGSETNLNYFGLLPHLVGQGLGTAFLRHAIERAWQDGATAMTVNTCSADNPRALPGYLAAGFERLREIGEAWHIPTRLGLVGRGR